MPADKALVNYIRDALGAGAGFEQIHQALQGQEWSEEAIAAAMAEATQPTAKPLPTRGLASPLPPAPALAPPGAGAGWQPPQPPPQPLRVGAPLGFAFALAGGLASLIRVLGGFATGAANPFTATLAPFALPLGALFSILVIVAALLLKKGKFAAGAIGLVLSLVLALFAADATLQLPALLGVLGGALGLAKQ